MACHAGGGGGQGRDQDRQGRHSHWAAPPALRAVHVEGRLLAVGHTGRASCVALLANQVRCMGLHALGSWQLGQIKM